jgi:hypothetical protein
MHVLGKCMRRYKNFLNDHDVIVSNFDTVLLTNRTFIGGAKNWCCKSTGDRCASYNEIAKLSYPILKVFHEKLCQKIMQDGGDYYRVIIFGDHAWRACTSWFPKKKVLNHGSIAHGSVVRNNYHREQARDDFLATVDRASAFLSGAETIPFVDSEKSEFLHIGNDPNRKKQLQPEKGARKEGERARKEEERAWTKEFLAREEEGIRRRKEEEDEEEKRARREEEEEEKRRLGAAGKEWMKDFTAAGKEWMKEFTARENEGIERKVVLTLLPHERARAAKEEDERKVASTQHSYEGMKS